MFGNVWQWTASPYVPLPKVRGTGRSARRIQWKIHVQSIRPARWLLRNVIRPHSQVLPELPPTRIALAVFQGFRLAK